MYKIFDRRTCGLSHQIKGPTTVKLAKTGFNCKIVKFTITGPLIWCDNPHVRLSKILYINNNDFHNLDRSQMCAGGCCYFRPSKPHSGTLWSEILNVQVHNFEILFRIHLFQEWGPWSVWRPRVAAAVVTRTVNTVMSLLRFINIPRMPPRPYHHHHRPAAPTSKTQFSTAADWASPFLWVYDLNTFLLQAALLQRRSACTLYNTTPIIF